MNINRFLLRLTCRQAASLLIAREDQVLKMSDRVALKLHLMACRACPQFKNQVLTLRAAMGQWRHYTGEADDKAISPNSTARTPP